MHSAEIGVQFQLGCAQVSHYKHVVPDMQSKHNPEVKIVPAQTRVRSVCKNAFKIVEIKPAELIYTITRQNAFRDRAQIFLKLIVGVERKSPLGLVQNRPRQNT